MSANGVDRIRNAARRLFELKPLSDQVGPVCWGVQKANGDSDDSTPSAASVSTSYSTQEACTHVPGLPQPMTFQRPCPMPPWVEQFAVCSNCSHPIWNESAALTTLPYLQDPRHFIEPAFGMRLYWSSFLITVPIALAGFRGYWDHCFFDCLVLCFSLNHWKRPRLGVARKIDYACVLSTLVYHYIMGWPYCPTPYVWLWNACTALSIASWGVANRTGSSGDHDLGTQWHRLMHAWGMLSSIFFYCGLGKGLSAPYPPQQFGRFSYLKWCCSTILMLSVWLQSDFLLKGKVE